MAIGIPSSPIVLILSRKIGESVVIDGRIIVKVVRAEGNQIKLGIDAPRDVPVMREELYEEFRQANIEALTQRGQPLPRLAVLRPLSS